MHHEVIAPEAGTVHEVLAVMGAAVLAGDRLIVLDESVLDESDRSAADDAGDASDARTEDAVGAHVTPDRARRPGRRRRAPRARPRREPADGGGAAPATGAPHGPRESGRPRRRRIVRGVRPARDRRATPSPIARRPDREHPGRWPRRWRRHGQRGPVRGRAVRRDGAHRACEHRSGGDVVRLHRARRHPGHPEPPEEGPSVRGRRTAAPPDRVPHRGWRWTAGRHRRHRRQRTGLSRVPLVR